MKVYTIQHVSKSFTNIDDILTVSLRWASIFVSVPYVLCEKDPLLFTLLGTCTCWFINKSTPIYIQYMLLLEYTV